MAKYNDVSANDTIDEIYRRNDIHNDELHVVQTRNHLGVWINATLINGFVAAGAPYGVIQYRKFFNDGIEFRGHLSVAGASSNTVAFILVRSHWPINDVSFITDMVTGVSSFSLARVIIKSSDGTVTLIWPAT